MIKTNRIRRNHIIMTLLLVFAMFLSYLAGTIFVEAKSEQSETRATTEQIAAVSAAVSLLLLGDRKGESLFLPIIMR
jgi:hypothetical protein